MFHSFEVLERSRCEVTLQKGASEQRPSYASAAHISAYFSPLLTSLQLCLCLRYPYMWHAKDIKVFEVVPLHRPLHSSEIYLSFFCSSPKQLRVNE